MSENRAKGPEPRISSYNGHVCRSTALVGFSKISVSLGFGFFLESFAESINVTASEIQEPICYDYLEKHYKTKKPRKQSLVLSPNLV